MPGNYKYRKKGELCCFLINYLTRVKHKEWFEHLVSWSFEPSQLQRIISGLWGGQALSQKKKRFERKYVTNVTQDRRKSQVYVIVRDRNARK